MCKKYLQQDSGSCKRLVLGLGFVNVKSFINLDFGSSAIRLEFCNHNEIKISKED
jgi:hypothetical protein